MTDQVVPDQSPDQAENRNKDIRSAKLHHFSAGAVDEIFRGGVLLPLSALTTTALKSGVSFGAGASLALSVAAVGVGFLVSSYAFVNTSPCSQKISPKKQVSWQKAGSGLVLAWALAGGIGIGAGVSEYQIRKEAEKQATSPQIKQQFEMTRSERGGNCTVSFSEDGSPRILSGECTVEPK